MLRNFLFFPTKQQEKQRAKKCRSRKINSEWRSGTTQRWKRKDSRMDWRRGKTTRILGEACPKAFSKNSRTPFPHLRLWTNVRRTAGAQGTQTTVVEYLSEVRLAVLLLFFPLHCSIIPLTLYIVLLWENSLNCLKVKYILESKIWA